MIDDPCSPVLIASNRGPVSFGLAEDGSLTARRGGGGLISGLTSGLAALAADSTLKADSVLWICAALSEADRVAARTGRVATGEAPGEAPVLMLDIPPATFDAAYNGIANSVLWFVHHMLFETPNQPQFGWELRRAWDCYAAYNEAFAAALADRAEAAPAGTGGNGTAPAGGSRVLIQDYHLALAPRMLRNSSPDTRIAHFSHTPWAPPAYYRMLPDDIAAAVLDGMLGADHVGFLAARWAEAFLDCCSAVLGVQVSRAHGPHGQVGQVSYRGRTSVVAVHPLGVDAAALRERASAEDVLMHSATLRKQTGGRQLIVRVDRTELSKNVTRGLAAYRELLATRPEWRGRVTHLAFAYPSRSGLAEYRAYTERIRALAQEINDEFAVPGWQPLILEVKDDYPRSLAACAIADVLLVNPIRDGMNLVAEEGPVLSERGCALVLSREAGAAALIGHAALLVNPYDVSATAEALHEALSMPRAERQRRCAAIEAAVATAVPAGWLAAQLAAL